MTQTAKNFYSNILTLVCNIAVGLYYTPYLVHNLGIEAYGVLPLVLIINQLINVLTGTLTHSYTRFYTIALQRGDVESANKVLSTSFWSVCLLALFTIPLLMVLCMNVDKVFKIPPSLVDDARVLFSFTVISFYVSIISSLLNVSLYAANKLDLMNVMKISRNVLKLIVVVFLFESISVNLVFVGISNFITELIVLGLSAYFFGKTRPAGIHLSLKNYDNAIMISIISMSAWILIHQCGDTLIYRTDNLLINHFWGTKMSGTLGAISELCSYILVIANVLGSLFGPLVLIAYSRSDHAKVKVLALQQSRIVGCLSAIIAGVLAGFSVPILDIWLGKEFSPFHSWMIVKLIVVPFYAAGAIMSHVYRAWNKVKMPAIGTLIIGVLNVAVTIILCLFFNNDSFIIIVISISALSSIIQSYVWNVFCVYKIYNTILYDSIVNAFKIVAAFMVACFMSSVIVRLLPVVSLPVLIVSLVLTGLVSLAVVGVTVISKEDRLQFLSVLR